MELLGAEFCILDGTWSEALLGDGARSAQGHRLLPLGRLHLGKYSVSPRCVLELYQIRGRAGRGS